MKNASVAALIAACTLAGLSACNEPAHTAATVSSSSPTTAAQQVSWISYKTTNTCTPYASCYELTPNGNGMVLINPQKQIFYVDIATGAHVLLATGTCTNLDCVAISPDSTMIAFTQTNGEQMAVYTAELPTSPTYSTHSKKPKHTGDFPRYATTTDPTQGTYKLSYCGSNQVVFGRANLNGNQTVHAFGVSSTRGQHNRRDLFYETDGTATDVQCDSTSGQAYFTIQRARSTANHQELIVRTSASQLQAHADAQQLETVFSRSSAPGDQFVYDVRLTENGQKMLFVMNTPTWDPFPLSGLMQEKISKDHDTAGETPLTTMTAPNSKILALLGNLPSNSANRSLIVEQGPFFNLVSVSNDDGSTVTLNTSAYFYMMNTVSTSQDGQTVAFLQGSMTFPQTQLVVTDILGKKLKILSSMLMDIGIPRDHQGPYLSSPTLTPNGKCVIASSSPIYGGSMNISVFPTSGATPYNLIPSTQTYTHIGRFQVKPDSSAVIFIGDPKIAGQNHIYSMKLTGCQ